MGNDCITVKQEGVLLRLSLETDVSEEALVYEVKSQMQDALAGWSQSLIGVTIRSYSSSLKGGVSIVFVITEGFTKYDDKVATLKELMLECDDFLYKKRQERQSKQPKPTYTPPAKVAPKPVAKGPAPTSFTLRGGDEKLKSKLRPKQRMVGRTR